MDGSWPSSESGLREGMVRFGSVSLPGGSRRFLHEFGVAVLRFSYLGLLRVQWNLAPSISQGLKERTK